MGVIAKLTYFTILLTREITNMNHLDYFTNAVICIDITMCYKNNDTFKH